MDEFSFDPRSWSKQKAAEAAAAGKPAAGKAAAVPTPGSLPDPPAEPATAPEPATQAAEKTTLPSAWNDVVTNFEPAPQSPAKAGRKAAKPPKAKKAQALPSDPPAAEAAPAPTPQSDQDAPQHAQATSLPSAWSDVVTNFNPVAEPAAKPAPPAAKAPKAEKPAAQASQDASITLESAPGDSRRLMLATLLSVVLVAGGAGGAWLTRPAPGKVPAAAVTAAPTVTAAQVLASESPPPASAVERAINLSSTADLAAALVSVGIDKAEAEAAAGAASAAMSAKGEIRATLTLLPAEQGFTLQSLQAAYSDGSGAVVSRKPNGTFSTRAVAADLTREVKVLRGELDSESFYTSAVTAGLIDTLIPEFINAFAFDFNLASEVAPGDTFEVAFEQSVNANGEAVGQPQLLFASLTTRQKSVALYRFKLPDGTIGWYDGNGASTRRGLMMTPVDGARITSKFGPRFHPVLHYTRLHGGTDFAAPVGTPIYAAAGGSITSASPSSCAGNMVIMRHDNGWVTRYFHLSRYADGLHSGQRVEQGFTIGYVGNTGKCTTGPHLHYEVHIDGVKVDPLSIRTSDSKRKRMDAVQLADFLKQRDRIDGSRAKQVF